MEKTPHGKSRSGHPKKGACQILTHRKETSKEGRSQKNGRTTTADRAGTSKRQKHLTKAEIEERQRTEVKAAADKVTAPQYLSPTQKRTFKKIVKELRAIDLISNLDVDALARLVIAQENTSQSRKN